MFLSCDHILSYSPLVACLVRLYHSAFVMGMSKPSEFFIMNNIQAKFDRVSPDIVVSYFVLPRYVQYHFESIVMESR